MLKIDKMTTFIRGFNYEFTSQSDTPNRKIPDQFLTRNSDPQPSSTRTNPTENLSLAKNLKITKISEISWNSCSGHKQEISIYHAKSVC